MFEVKRHRGAAQRVGATVVELVRHAPGTLVYLLVVTVTVWLLSSLDAHTADVLLRSASTNIVEMSRSAPRVLVLSAFVVSSGNVLTLALLFAVVHLPAERWLGTRRWLAVIVAGHVGASMMTTVGILVLLHTGHEGRALVYPIDVGVSYTLAAAAAALTLRLQRPLRIVWLGGVLVFLRVDELVTAPTFTDVGHACAVAIGLATAALLLPARSGVSLAIPRTRSLRQWWDYVRQPPPKRRTVEAMHTGRWPAAGLLAALLVGSGLVWLAGVSAARTSNGIVSLPAEVTAVEPTCASGCPRLHLEFTYDQTRQEITSPVTAASRVRVGDTRLVQFRMERPQDAVISRTGEAVDPAGFLSLAAITAFGAAGLMAIVIVRRRHRLRVERTVIATADG